LEDIIKKELFLYMEKLKNWGGPFEDDADDMDYHFADKTLGIGIFIKECALAEKNYELAGVAEDLVMQSRKRLKVESDKWSDYQDELARS